MVLVGFYRTILTLSMRAFGPRISAYPFWTTTDIHTYRPTYHAKSRLNTPVWGSLRSLNNYVSCVQKRVGRIIYNYIIYITRKMVPITGGASSVLRKVLCTYVRIQKQNRKEKTTTDKSILPYCPHTMCTPPHPKLYHTQ